MGHSNIAKEIAITDPYLVLPADIGGRGTDWKVAKLDGDKAPGAEGWYNTIEKFEYKDDARIRARELSSRQGGSGIVIMNTEGEYEKFEPNPRYWSAVAPWGNSGRAMNKWQKRKGGE